jgi:3-deoxy-D-manno-octulosonate 8-phosphate phosphatase (KDO 8-P phosphatase)
MSLPPDEITRRAARVRLLLTDCDGVLTDGRLYYSADSEPCAEVIKVFHIHDGLGLRLAKRAGLKLGIISGRKSAALEARARELGVDYLFQGDDAKLGAYERILGAEKLSDEQVAYVGDDLPDLPLLRRVGFAVAVADAVAEVRAAAHHVTARPGGAGAVREAVELILKAQGRWAGLVNSYTPD